MYLPSQARVFRELRQGRETMPGPETPSHREDAQHTRRLFGRRALLRLAPTIAACGSSLRIQDWYVIYRPNMPMRNLGVWRTAQMAFIRTDLVRWERILQAL